MAGLEGTMSDSWDPTVLARIARSHRVIVFDYRGAGRSMGDLSQFSIPQLADEAARLIHALRLGRADVWGQSVGGYVAQDLAIRHPSVIRRLVLTATAFGDGRWILRPGGVGSRFDHGRRGRYRRRGDRVLSPSGYSFIKSPSFPKNAIDGLVAYRVH